MKLFNRLCNKLRIARSSQPPSKFHTELPVIRGPRSIEALLEIIALIIGLFIVYFIFAMIGNFLFGEDFRPDTLLSLVVLPAIYILKDSYIVFEPYFVRIWLSDNDVSVESGILTKAIDCLDLKNVENVELVTSILGRFFDYGTLRLYAYGSWVEMPHVHDVSNVKLKIDNRIKPANNGQRN